MAEGVRGMNLETGGDLVMEGESKGVERLEEVRLPYGEIWFGDDGITRTEYYPGTEIGFIEAIEIGAAITRVCGGKPRPLFTDSRGITRLTRRARGHLASKDISQWSIAIATYSTLLLKALGKLFAMLNKPSYPIQYVVSKEDAMEWLKRYLK